MPTFIDSERLLVSLAPEALDVAARFDANVELKFDWEDDAILAGQRPLSAVINDAGISPSRIRTVHIPPGITHRHGMAVTPENRGTIVDFVHSQLESVSNASLTAHPPKEFDYRELLHLLAELPSLTDRKISIENLPVDCQWHTIPALAYYAHLSREIDQLDEFRLTIDTAHLPERPRRPNSVRPLGDSWAEELVASLAAQDLSLPAGFVDECETRLKNSVDEYVPSGALSVDRMDRWTPFAQTVFLIADRIESVHLNDPRTDDVPLMPSYDSEPLLKCALDCLQDHDVSIVLEPSEGRLEEIPELIEEVLSDW